MVCVGSYRRHTVISVPPYYVLILLLYPAWGNYKPCVFCCFQVLREIKYRCLTCCQMLVMVAVLILAHILAPCCKEEKVHFHLLLLCLGVSIRFFDFWLKYVFHKFVICLNSYLTPPWDPSNQIPYTYSTTVLHSSLTCYNCKAPWNLTKYT